jgi:hypothetical protein
MTQTTLHVVFTPSGAGCLSQALETAGRDDQVISFFDDLSFGPIEPPDSSLRAKWVENELSRTGWDDVTAESERFWRRALSSDQRTVAWLTRRSNMEYAGFLEWSWRMGDAPYEVVDLSEVKVSYRPEHGPPRPPAFHESWDASSGHHMPRPVMGAGRTVAADRTRAISGSLAAAPFGKCTAARYRWRRARVGANLVLRFAADVLRDGQLAESGEGRRPSIGRPNG